MVEANTAVHPSTCQVSHYHLQTGEAARLCGRQPTAYPRLSRGAADGIWWRPLNWKHQLSRDLGCLSSWRLEFNEMVYCAHA